MTLYEELKKAGVEIDYHHSDLYAKVCPESKAIIERYRFKNNVEVFKSNKDGKLWYDIPFAYDPGR